MEVLVLNSGSTSLKFSVFDKQSEKLLGKGVYNYNEVVDFAFEQNGGELQEGFFSDRNQVLDHLFGLLRSFVMDISKLVIVHRIVHGGDEFIEPFRLFPDTLQALSKWGELAPLHQPEALRIIESIRGEYPDIIQLGVTDTAFHYTINEEEYLYGLPYAMQKKHGLRKYGFHGISHQWAYTKLKEVGVKKLKNVVSLHLGGGCSVCAIKNGESVATSMGISPESGLIMATRSGDVDGGVVIKLLREGVNVNVLEDILNRQSGLFGLSGTTSNLKEILDSKDHGRNALALEMYVERIVASIATMITKLNGIDALVFTGTIGYNSQEIRDLIVDRLGVFKIGIKAGEEIADGVWRQMDSKPGVFAVETNEELMMLRLWKGVGVKL